MSATSPGRPSSGAVPAEPAPAVALDRVCVELGGRRLLHDVSLTVAPGEFVAVLGPNGAGKSTLMRTILGLIPIQAGSARVLGADPRRARRRIGYLPQRQGFDAGTRIRGVDLVRLGLDGARWGLPLGLTPAARRRHRSEHERITQVIDRVGAGAYAHRALGELSGGEQQRLLIAAALVRDPEVLILDEPLDSLDLPNQAAVAALVGDVARRDGVAVLLVAHDINPLLQHVDRVVYLADGHALCGSVAEVVTGPKLSALYGTPVEVLTAGDGRLVVVGGPDAPHHHSHDHP